MLGSLGSPIGSWLANSAARPDVRLWAVDSANHPAADAIVRKWAGATVSGLEPVVAVDGRAGACGAVVP